MDEFALIRHYFQHMTAQVPQSQIVLGIGDDCALIRPVDCSAPNKPPSHEPDELLLAVSTDTLVSGVHFPVDTYPEDIGHKALAVNLSDLAAMGANPCWFTLALTLPGFDTDWLTRFVKGMGTLAGQTRMPLVGGDTTQGPLSLTLTVGGQVPAGLALTRAGAVHGDGLYVSGMLGLAAAGLRCLRGTLTLPPEAAQAAINALNRPQPRLQLGLALRGLATSCIDISDGLLADLTHVLQASHKMARIDPDAIPMPEWLRSLDFPIPYSLGDDYELLFTAPAQRHEQIQRLASELNLPITLIGHVYDRPTSAGANILDLQGNPIEQVGYRHF